MRSGGQAQRRVGLEAAIGNPGQLEVRSEFGAQHRGIVAQQFDHPAADGTATEQADPHRFHRILPDHNPGDA